MLNVAYGLTRTFPKTTPEQARERITSALQQEGFGILTEIDVRATFKKKLDVDFRPFLILGACNPQIAHKALSAEPGFGLLLPCNVVVTQSDEGDAVVSIANPQAIFDVVRRPELASLADEAEERLRRALKNA